MQKKSGCKKKKILRLPRFFSLGVI